MKINLVYCPKCKHDTLQVKRKIPRWGGPDGVVSCFKVKVDYCTLCGSVLVDSPLIKRIINLKEHYNLPEKGDC